MFVLRRSKLKSFTIVFEVVTRWMSVWALALASATQRMGRVLGLMLFARRVGRVLARRWPRLYCQILWLQRSVDKVVGKLPGWAWATGAVTMIFAGFLFIRITGVQAATTTVLPISDVQTGWIPSTGTTHYTLVGEGTAPSTADYVSTGTGGSSVVTDEYGLQSVSSVASASQMVISVYAQSATNANGGTLDTLNINLSVSGTLQTAAICTPAYNVWAWCTATFTGSWTQTSVSAMHVVISNTINGSGKASGKEDNIQVADVYGTLTYVSSSQMGQNAYQLFSNIDAGSSATTAFTAGQGSPYATGGSPLDDKLVDVNGDGCPDLMVGSQTANAVSVYINKCDGTNTFNSPASYAANGNPNTITAGDVNGDGCPDIVAANNFNGSNPSVFTVSVFINKCNGSGTFNAQATYPTGNYPNSVVVTDVNGDGHSDILVVNNDNIIGNGTFSVLLNNGDGTFPVAAPSATYGVGIYPRWITTADLNGDGCPDVVVTNTNDSSAGGSDVDNTVSVLLNKCNGTGQFNPQVKYTAGTYPQFVTAKDLNGDGCPDIVTVNANSDNISVFLNNCNGTGTFPATGTTYSMGTGSNPWYAVIADFNGDGKLDIVTADRGASANNVAILLGNGDGTFPTTGPSATYAVGTSPRAVAAASLNGGSSKPDLAVVNFTDSTVSVLLNTSSMPVGVPLNGVSQDTAATVPGDGQPFRLRIGLGVTGGTLSASSGSFKLQYAPISGSCDATTTGYNDVTNTSTVQYYNNPNGLNGAPLATNVNDPKDSINPTNPLVYETYQQQGTTTFTNPFSIPSGSDGVWDFALTTYHTLVGQHYCLRIINGDSSTLNSYATGAKAEIIMPPSTITQAGYRWFQNNDQAPSVYPVSEHISTGGDVAYAAAIDPAGGYMYVAGWDATPGTSNSEWRIEKRSLATGALVSSFGTSGAISEDIRTGNDVATTIAIDPASGYMYVAGYDTALGGTSEWRIEKRSLATGALVSGFGTSGAISENIGGNGDVAYSLAIDPAGGYMYVAGSDSIMYELEWRIEKRSLATGALVSGFGTSGAISEDISTSNETVYALAIDPAGGYMYVAGYDATPGANSYEWRIEKRSLATGALVSGFGTSGAISEDISTGGDAATALAIDPAGGYMYVAGYDATPSASNYEWRIEKRSLATGALVSGFGTSGAISEDISTRTDEVATIAIDPASGYMYVAGWDSTPSVSNYEWRIEKRSLATGALVSGFGTSGAISENISTGGDVAYSLAIDPAGGYMYVAGYDSTPGGSNYEWRIESRSLSTGGVATLSATPLMPQNKVADVTDGGSNNQPFRLRLLMQIGASGADVSTLSLKLQYAPISGGNCSATPSVNFADVSTSTAIHFYAGNTNITDGMALAPYSNDPADGTNSIVYQTYKDINPFTNGQGIIYAGQDGLWDFPLQFAPNASRTTWCLRVVQSSTGTALNGYSVYPQINSAATMQQLMRGGEWWSSAGVRQPISLGQ